MIFHKNLFEDFYLHNVPNYSVLDGDDDEDDNTAPEQERLLTTPSQNRQESCGTGVRFESSYEVLANVREHNFSYKIASLEFCKMKLLLAQS